MESFTYTSKQLEDNIKDEIEKKGQKEERYVDAFAEYAKSIDEGRPYAYDKTKKQEFWLLIEVITPDQIEVHFDAIRDSLAQSKFEGAIFVDNNDPSQMPVDVSQIVFVRRSS